MSGHGHLNAHGGHIVPKDISILLPPEIETNWARTPCVPRIGFTFVFFFCLFVVIFLLLLLHTNCVANCFVFFFLRVSATLILWAKANRKIIIANNCVLWPGILEKAAKCERSVSPEGRCGPKAKDTGNYPWARKSQMSRANQLREEQCTEKRSLPNLISLPRPQL